MRRWLLILGGLIVWTAHFFVVYALGEFGGERTWWLVLLVTIPGIAVCVWIWFAVARLRVDGPFDRWTRTVGQGGAALSGLAVLWQGLPGLI